MSSVETTRTVTDGAQSSSEQTVVAYEYDSAGNRVASTTSTSVDGGSATTVRREFLTEQQNHTGYSQVLQETEFDGVGNPTEKIVYTIGHDQISQTSYLPLPQGEGWGEGSVAYFGTDGHGSVRVLYDAAAAIVQSAGIPQIYHFDAYGNLLNLVDGTQPITSYLYSGEAIDFTIGQQYLRARWYDPTTGRFNRLDPFFGNQSDPQSFHKYAYVHGDPVNGVDPTGMFLGLAFGVGLQMMLPGPGDFIIGGLQALVQAYVVNLEWDIEWAQDLSLPDSWGSRLDNSWVYSALGAGMHNAMWIGIPFTDIGFNPLDQFSARRPPDYPSGAHTPLNGLQAIFRSALFSFRVSMEYANSLGRKIGTHVDFYTNPRMKHYKVLRFNRQDIFAEFKITPNRPKSLERKDLDRASKADIQDALEILQTKIARGEIRGIVVEGPPSKLTARTTDGIELTVHHDLKFGHVQVVPRELHRATQGNGGNHIGHAYWWNPEYR